MIVDSHQHFWAPARGDYDWMGTGDALKPLRRDFHPQHFEAFRAKHGIDKTVLVQAAATVNETEYMLGLADATDWIGKVVGWVDFENPSHRKHLERLARHRKFAGVRPMIQDIPDTDWMFRPDVQWGYQALIDLDLTFDALGYPIHLDNFLKLFTRYPKLPVVVDHCMKPRIRDDAFDDWAKGIARIARETQAFCKLSGLATEAKPGWTVATLKPYAEHVIDVFGPARVMWGSDWPVLELNGTYDSWREAALTIVGNRPGKSAIFGETAAKFYRL